jgi:hypothetical protein
MVQYKVALLIHKKKPIPIARKETSKRTARLLKK